MNTAKKEGKRVPLNMRTTATLRAKMEKAANKSGRSLAQEVEARLEQSFSADDRAISVFGGQEKYQLFKMLSDAAEMIESRTGNSWLADGGAAKAAYFVWEFLLAQLLPGFAQKPLVPIPDMPEMPVHPLSGTLSTRLANMSGDDVEQERKELGNANMIHNKALIEHQEKLAQIAAALDENSDILVRDGQRIVEWYERFSKPIDEAISTAKPLFPPRRK